jgi:hypothetical protein
MICLTREIGRTAHRESVRPGSILVLLQPVNLNCSRCKLSIMARSFVQFTADRF